MSIKKRVKCINIDKDMKIYFEINKEYSCEDYDENYYLFRILNNGHTIKIKSLKKYFTEINNNKETNRETKELDIKNIDYKHSVNDVLQEESFLFCLKKLSDLQNSILNFYLNKGNIGNPRQLLENIVNVDLSVDILKDILKIDDKLYEPTKKDIIDELECKIANKNPII